LKTSRVPVIAALIALFAIAMVSAGCGSGTSTSNKPATTAPTTTAAPTTPQGPTVLTVTNGAQSKTFTMAQIKAMNPASGYAGQKNKQGVISGPFAYKGVAVVDLLATVGGLPTGASIKVTASDGFAKSFTNAQLSQGSFTLYDKTGAEAAAESKPVVFLAYEKDGAALDATTGPLQAGILSGQNRVSDNSLWVKMATAIEVVPAQ
jgi:hypothetical protein